ncbi:MAG: hypothetical protein ACOVSR_15160 [Bacteroidia bacterium]
MKKNILYCSIAIIVILIATNPSLRDFKEHIGYDSKAVMRDNFYIQYNSAYKVHNYLIFSIYVCDGVKHYGFDYSHSNQLSEKYYGILSNFYLK